MKMTHREMKAVLAHDILKYVGPSIGGLLHNKLYTVKEIDSLRLGLFMPKGQSINVDILDHDLWEMHEAKGADMAKHQLVQGMTAEFYSHLAAVNDGVNELNIFAEDMDNLLKDFPLDSKMKLLGTLSKDQLEVLEFLNKIRKTKLTTTNLIKAFKRNKNGA